MDLQGAIAVVVVAACFIHAIVVLSPALLRRRVAAMLLRIPLLSRSARLARASEVSGGCGGCGSCRNAAPGPAGRHVVTLHRPTTPG
jgi:hypothetical protein